MLTLILKMIQIETACDGQDEGPHPQEVVGLEGCSKCRRQKGILVKVRQRLASF